MLRIYDDALQIVRRLQPYLERIRRRQASLADQLDRAADSVVLGIAEGSRSMGKNRALHYTRGAASMDEAIGCLDLAVAKGHIPPVDDDLRQQMKRVVGTLLKARLA
jgi:four helix bundle protein